MDSTENSSPFLALSLSLSPARSLLFAYCFFLSRFHCEGFGKRLGRMSRASAVFIQQWNETQHRQRNWITNKLSINVMGMKSKSSAKNKCIVFDSSVCHRRLCGLKRNYESKYEHHGTKTNHKYAREHTSMGQIQFSSIIELSLVRSLYRSPLPCSLAWLLLLLLVLGYLLFFVGFFSLSLSLSSARSRSLCSL